MKYREALQWIHSRERFGIRPGLGRVRCILEQLSNPHRNLKVIHIAGSNGKGSTAAFAASILREAGLKTGLYTSPYLESFTNRMAVDGKDVAPEILTSLVARVKPVVEEVTLHKDLGPPTEFEVVTVLALLYFARVEVDCLVLEVGLGGRLDATNVVETPLVSVITNISREHEDILGDTIGKIAGEKAGIIKEGVPVVTAATDPEALEVLEGRAFEAGAPFFRVGRDFCFEPRERSLEGQYFNYQGQKAPFPHLFIPLLGEHQVVNAATALAALELSGQEISPQAVREGLKKTRWPGRFEILGRDPFVVIDAAHNPDGMKNLGRALEDLFPRKNRVVLLGILKDKSIRQMLEHIIPVADRLIITRALHPTRAEDPCRVAEEARLLTDKPVMAVPGLEEALKTGKGLAEGGILCIAGSFYTVSEARRLIVEEGIL